MPTRRTRLRLAWPPIESDWRGSRARPEKRARRPLQSCSDSPLTGFFRDGCCNTSATDVGLHVVCARMTADFRSFSKANGHDLETLVPGFGFPGLRPAEQWCLCVARWNEALAAGVAPPVRVTSTQEAALRVVALDELKRHAIDLA